MLCAARTQDDFVALPTQSGYSPLKMLTVTDCSDHMLNQRIANGWSVELLLEV